VEIWQKASCSGLSEPREYQPVELLERKEGEEEGNSMSSCSEEEEQVLTEHLFLAEASLLVK
jgi:hypothetical protein